MSLRLRPSLRRRTVALLAAAAAAVAGVALGAPAVGAGTPPSFGGSNNATAVIGQPFGWSASLAGDQPFTVSVNPNVNNPDQIPGGLALNTGTGDITGTPNAGTAGVYHIRLHAQNNAGGDNKNLTLTVEQLPKINGPDSATAIVGQSSTVWTPSTLTGSPDPVVSVDPNMAAPDALPAGLAVNPSTGVVSGTPAAGTGGVYNVRLKAHNDAGSDFKKIQLTVNEAAVITGDTTADGQVAVPFSWTPTITGWPPTFTVTVQSGTLPPGLSLDAGTGAVTGTPTQHGTFPVTLKAANDTGSSTIDVTFSIAVGQITGLDPTISGLAQVTHTLTADPGPVVPADSTFSYVWKADGTVIPGAHGSTLYLDPSLAGAHIRVRITASHAEYANSSATSDATPYVREYVKRPTLTLSDDQACRGQQVQVLAQGLKPGKLYTLHAPGKTLTKAADEYGEFKAAFDVPVNLGIGSDESVTVVTKNGKGAGATLVVTCGGPV